MRPIIVGIDPGTTVGYTILDLEGNIVSVNSQKHVGLDSLIEEIYEYGNPLLVGCDKKIPPPFVKSFSSRTESLVKHPFHDPTPEEKKKLISIKTNNSHESDSLYSAMFAFTRERETLNKIIDYCNTNDLELGRMAKKVLMEGLNLKEAQRKEYETNVKVIKKRAKQEDNIKKLVRTNEDLRSKNEELKERIRQKNQKLKDLRDKNTSEKKSKYTENLKTLSNKLLRKDKEIEDLNKKINSLKGFLEERRNMIVKKFKTLNNIKPQDKFIFVENPESNSRKEIDSLKGNVHYILTKKDFSNKELPFTFIDVNPFIIEDTDDFIKVDKKKLSDKISKNGVVEKIINEYKKERRGRFIE